MISQAKRNELQAAGKCFQCEETRHDQQNCPKLQSIRRPTMNAVNIKSTRREHTRRVRNSPDIRLLAVNFRVGCNEEFDDATDKMWRAYGLCALEWGLDECWIGVGTHLDSRYFIYQYDTLTELVVEVRDKLQSDMGTLEMAVSQFADPEFRLKDIYLASANTGSICVQEGGWYCWLQDRL